MNPVSSVLRVIPVTVLEKVGLEPIVLTSVVMVTGPVTLVLSQVTATLTVVSTAGFTVMVQVREREVPAWRGEVGGVRETVGIGTEGNIIRQQFTTNTMVDIYYKYTQYTRITLVYKLLHSPSTLMSTLSVTS